MNPLTPPVTSAVGEAASGPGRAPIGIVVIPCYNEAHRLDPEPFGAFLNLEPAWRIHFVDDGSRDGTVAVLEALQRRFGAERIRVQVLERNGGKGEAVRLGILEALRAGPDFVGFWDADLSTSLKEVTRFREVLERSPGCIAAIGSRVKLLGRSIERRALRHYVGRIFATGASLALRLDVYDTQCGAKLFRNCAAVEFAFARPFRSRWIFDVELLGRIFSALDGPRGVGAASPVHEVPLLAWQDVPGSKVKLRDGMRAVIELLAVARDVSRAERERPRGGALPAVAVAADSAVTVAGTDPSGGAQPSDHDRDLARPGVE